MNLAPTLQPVHKAHHAGARDDTKDAGCSLCADSEAVAIVGLGGGVGWRFQFQQVELPED